MVQIALHVLPVLLFLASIIVAPIAIWRSERRLRTTLLTVGVWLIGMAVDQVSGNGHSSSVVVDLSMTAAAVAAAIDSRRSAGTLKGVPWKRSLRRD